MLLGLPLRAAQPDYAAQVEQARAARVAELRQPDGYLSLIASGWLEPGANTLGTAADNRIVLPQGPAHLGTLWLGQDGVVRLQTAPDQHVQVDGQPRQQVVMATQGADGKQRPTRAYVGQAYLYVIENGDQRGLRMKDNHADTRVHFAGLSYFPIDPSWRIRARWEPYATPHALNLAYATGAESASPAPGRAVFERDGRRYALTPIEEDGRLFFVFSDRTAGKLTYGGARFLYAAMPVHGEVVLDFNLAQNPPCAITPHVVCPLAPADNRLPIEVRAGELKFAGHP